MELLGSPELEYPVVHLTGTNGKTSVTRMTAALLEAAGLSVGAYTSPHLDRVNERIVWNGEPITDDELDELLVAVAAVEDLLPDAPSYFEILTAAAFRWFADVAVDVAVVEVGLGGTWDATNVVDADVAVVTNVSIDHVEYLGPTLGRDRGREGGHRRSRRPTLVLGETDPELVPVSSSRASPASVAAARRRLRRAREPARASAVASLDLYTPHASYDDVFLPLHGAHQADNAAIALDRGGGVPRTRARRRARRRRVRAACARRAGSRSSGTSRSCCSTARTTSPARTRCAPRSPTSSPTSPRTLVVGLLREKEPHEMLEALGATDATRLVCCRPDSPRGLDAEVVAEAAYDLGVDREIDRRGRRRARGGRPRPRRHPGRRPGRHHRLALRGRPGPGRARGLKARSGAVR